MMSKPLIVNDDDAKDSIYRLIAKDPDFEFSRKYVESLWIHFDKFADKKFKKQIRDSFHQAFSEMYFTVVIKNLQKNISSKDAGPDICLEKEDIFIECIAPTDGSVEISNTQALPEVTQLIAPNGDLLLSRYTHAICEKYAKFQEYIAYDQYPLTCKSTNVVAINCADISENRYCINAPHILKALFPIGFPMVYRDGNSYIQTTSSKPNIFNQNDAPIETNLFLSKNSSLLSAVIYSDACAINNAIPLNHIGSDIMTIHNPMAKNPLQKGFVNKGKELFLIDKKTLTFEITNYETGEKSNVSYGNV